MIRAIAFDFDGVLVESVDVKTQAFAQLFEREDEKNIDRIVAYHLENGGLSRFNKFRTIYREILKRPLPEEEFEALGKRFAALVIDKVVSAPWVPGAKEFIEKHHESYPFYIISGTPEDELIQIVQRRGIEKYFKETLGSPKSKDILIKSVLEKYSLNPEEVLFVGDAQNDWNAAKKTNVKFILRKTGHEIDGYRGPSLADLKNLHQFLNNAP